MPKHMATAWLAVGTLLLAGCSTLLELIPSELMPSERTPSEAAPSEREERWQAHTRALLRFQTWTMRGTLVVRSGDDASRLNMRWHQARESYRMQFTALLGAGLFELEGSRIGVKARFADGRRVRADSPEALLEQEIGWSVPLDGLRYWIVGAPAPDGSEARAKLDGQGRLARLEQSGWTVVYEKYGVLDDLALPERIRFSNASVDATVVVRRWKAEQSPG